MAATLHIVCPHCDTTNRVPRAKLADGGKCGKCGERLFSGRPLPLDGRRFGLHAESSDIPLLVDFWAAWCRPCHMMAPIFEQAAAQLEPDVRLAKVDTEAERDLAGRFAIHSIPSLVLYHRGREIARTAGAVPLAQLVAWTRQHLPRPA